MVEELVGVVLAAGAGTRLSPLTRLRPKALCPVNNRPLVDWALERATPLCAAVAVNVHHHRDQLVQHLDGRRVHLSIEEPEPLGTAGALGRLRDWIAGRPVLVTNADAWEMDGGALAHLLEGWDGTRPRLRCAVASGRGDFGDLTYVGSALLPWWAIVDLEPEPAGIYEVSWARLHAQGLLELSVERTSAGPIDCGTPRTYLQANMCASGGKPVIGAGAVVEGELVRSVVWPGSVVGRHERLVNSIRAQDLTVQVVPPPAGEE